MSMRIASYLTLLLGLGWITAASASTGASVVTLPASPPARWTYTARNSLNQLILKFCRANLNRKVGDGQCAALLTEAVRFAGGRIDFANRRDTRHSDDYVWGRLVTTLTVNNRDASKVRPGDLLQIRGPRNGAAFAGKANNGGTYWQSLYQHSAVVQAVARTQEGWWLMTYDQNVGNPKTGRMEQWVHEGTKLKLRDMQKGVTIWVYRATR
jgi:hypothetical protein